MQMGSSNPFPGLCLGLCLYFFGFTMISAEVIHEHITADILPGTSVESLQLTITETLGVVAEMSTAMSESSAATVMAEQSVCAKLTIIMNSSAAPTTSLPQSTSALAQVAAQSAPNSPPSMTASTGDTSSTANTVQSTAIAAAAASQSPEPLSSSPCDCQCMCPSMAFQRSPNPPAMVATPDVPVSSPVTMISSTNAVQSSLLSMAAQPTGTNANVAQQANFASTASSTSSTPEMTVPAQISSPASESSAVPLIPEIATPMTPSANLSLSIKTSTAPVFNINTYPLSSAVTAPVVLEK